MKRPFPAYSGSKPYVFACYSHEDQDLVYPEIARLHETGYRVWYDEGIAPASDWSEALARAIDHCAMFLFFVTPRAVASEHCRREVNYALERDCAMVTVHLCKTDLPHGLKLSLSNRQAILRYEHSKLAYERKLHDVLGDLDQDEVVRTRRTAEFYIGEHLVRPSVNRIGDDRIEPKSMEVLLALADTSPDPMTPEELLAHVWQDAVVVDNVVHKAVGRLRRALGDDAQHPKFIETVPRRGYRLIAQHAESVDNRIDQEQEARPRRVADRLGWRLLIVGAVSAATVAVVSIGWWRAPDAEIIEAPAVARQSHAIAVLPLENLSPDPNNAYFAAGIHEAILSQLAKVRGLSVIARTSVRKYENTALTIPEIARELNVESVLEGSVQYAGNEMRITALLVDAQTGAHVWSQTYDRSFEDIFSVQSNVATDIAVALGQQISAEEQRQIDLLPTHSTEAYRHYLKALSLLNEFAPLDPAIAELDQALSFDPVFAQGLAWKSYLLTNQAGTAIEGGRTGGVSISGENYSSLMARAEQLASQALEIDPEQPMAYMTMAAIAASEGRWSVSLSNAARAYRLNPNQPLVAFLYARELAGRGMSEATLLLDMALERDPHNVRVVSGVADGFFALEDYERAVEVAQQAVSLAPEQPLLRAVLAAMASRAGNEALALEASARAEVLYQRPVTPSAWDAAYYAILINCYRSVGRFDDAERLFGELQNLESGAVPPAMLGDVYLSLGRHEEALGQYRRALDEGSQFMMGNLAFMRNHSKYDQLRDYPEFQKMLAEIPAAH